jgi:hypothetical protein
MLVSGRAGCVRVVLGTDAATAPGAEPRHEEARSQCERDQAGDQPDPRVAVTASFAERRRADHLDAEMRQFVGASSRRRAARRNPRNITKIPARSESENGTR